MGKHVYTVDEAREQLGGMSRAVFYEEVKRERLRTFTVGRRRYISNAALRAYVRDRERENAVSES